MSHLSHTLLKFSAILFFVLGLSACEINSAEDAGEQIDEAATDVGNAIEDACENVKEQANADDEDC